MHCDCCKKPFSYDSGWKKAMYTLPGYVYEFYYCSPECREEHRLKLIRESGL